MEKLLVENLYFAISDRKSDKITYNILDKTKQKIIIELKNIFVPFGLEIYKKTSILNIEINPKNSNQHYNYHTIINTFEKELSSLSENNSLNILKNDIGNIPYYPNIRESKGGYILRTHLLGSTNIYSMIGDYKNRMSASDLKKTICDISIELSTLWIMKDNYGFVWNIKNIEIKSSV
jgi:hypothetical protein